MSQGGMTVSPRPKECRKVLALPIAMRHNPQREDGMRNIGQMLAAVLVLAATSCAATPDEHGCVRGTGRHGGYFFTSWRDSDPACMTLGEAGHYAVTWDLRDRGNIVVGKGWSKGSPTRRIGYRASAFEPGSNGYLTLYGWTTDPLIEYYVVDSWGAEFTPPGEDATVLGTVDSDGGTYRIYRTQRVEKPSIEGTQTFYQYWSVRTEKRALGADSRITFANHVAAWRALGLELGTMDYQVMATEGFGSTGRSDVTVWRE
jgi:endo-1,4-beta-xylanase